MRAGRLSGMLVFLVAAALCTFLSPAAANVLDFIELPNEGGITALQDGGHTASASTADETIQLFDRNQDGSGFRGLGAPGKHIFNLLENDGSGAISDQVVVFAACPGALQPPCDEIAGFGGVRVMFTSDPGQFDLGTADLTTIEDGTRQFVGSYLNNNGIPVQLYVTSDVDAVPEPASIALLALGLTSLGFARRKLGK